MSPKVSVILPVFNGEAFVESAVRSILSQEGVLEVLAHDDGSKDSTLALLTQLSSKDARLRVSTGLNAGPAAARNRCLRDVKGEFIGFLDHDDLWPTGRLKRQIDLLEAHSSVGVVLGHTLIFETLDACGAPDVSARSRRVFAGFLQAGLFRRSALDPLGGFDPDLVAADDFDFLLRLIESEWALEVDPEVAVFYRLHSGQWTADNAFSGRQTLRALRRSLQRRRRAGVAFELRRP